MQAWELLKIKAETERLEAIKKCDEIIILPGGTGTLEELLYCNETLRSTEHTSKVTLVNFDSFFNGLLEQINTNIEQGFSNPSTIKFEVVNNVNQIAIFNKNIDKSI